MSKSMSKISGLDGLRGVAATLVLLTHMSNWGYNIFPGADFRGAGRSGVILFFVLSSFLLSSQVLSWAPGLILSPKRWLSYFEARVLRIWPLFLVVLFFSLTTNYLHLMPLVWRVAPILRDMPVLMPLDSLYEHLLMRKGEDVLWTIPVEFKFYLLLPLLLVLNAVLLQNRRMMSIVVLSLGILIAYWLFPVVDGGINTFPFIGVFLTGILLAFIRYNDIDTLPIGKSYQVLYEILAWLCFTILLCLIPSVYLMLTGKMVPIVEVEENSLYALLWALMILFMLLGSGIMRRILDSRIFVFVGMISFSLYLWHRIPIILMTRLTYFHYVDFLPHGLKVFIILLMSIGIAYISYVFVEKPVQQWRVKRKLYT